MWTIFSSTCQNLGQFLIKQCFRKLALVIWRLYYQGRRVAVYWGYLYLCKWVKNYPHINSKWHHALSLFPRKFSQKIATIKCDLRSPKFIVWGSFLNQSMPWWVPQFMPNIISSWMFVHSFPLVHQTLPGAVFGWNSGNLEATTLNWMHLCHFPPRLKTLFSYMPTEVWDSSPF